MKNSIIIICLILIGASLSSCGIKKDLVYKDYTEVSDSNQS